MQFPYYDLQIFKIWEYKETDIFEKNEPRDLVFQVQSLKLISHIIVRIIQTYFNKDPNSLVIFTSQLIQFSQSYFMPSRPQLRFKVYKTRHIDVLQTMKRRRVFTRWSRFLVLFYMNGGGITIPSYSSHNICFQNNAKKKLVRPSSLSKY